MMTNKAVEMLKKTDRSKIKLPEVNKLNLIVQSYKKVQRSNTEGEDTLQVEDRG